VSEFVAKWVAAAFLLGFAWRARRVERGRALGLFLAALALLAFEVGLEESLLEIACAALLAREARMRPGAAGRPGRVALAITCAALVFFAARPWVAAALRALS
jgi:hypothetical protein